MSGHTKGPWERQAIDDDGTVCIIGADLGGLVGAALPWPSEIDSQDFCRVEANARLIAAAPDLLAELKRLRRAYVNLLEIGRDRIVELGGTCDPVDVMEAGDPSLRSSAEIVAKAEGRP